MTALLDAVKSHFNTAHDTEVSESVVAESVFSFGASEEVTL